MHEIKTNSFPRIFLHKFQAINHKYATRNSRNNFKEPKRERLIMPNIAFIRGVRLFKLGFHRGKELHRSPSLPVINLVGAIEGLSPNLHHRRRLGRWKSKSFAIHRPSSSSNHVSFLLCWERSKDQVCFK